jgi:Peptidase family C25/Propeptide_C25/FlgD Ig-like domain/Carboxypeptidase regulatory-like domain
LKRKYLILILLIFTLCLNADWTQILENSDQKLFEHETRSSDLTEVSFNLDGYSIESITQNEVEFQQISYWNEGKMLDIGKPDLPIFSRLIAIPNEGTPELEIVSWDVDVISDITIYPQQELQSESNPNRAEFCIDEEFYESGNKFPPQLAILGETAILRDYRVVKITINPFQYDSVNRELSIYKNIEVKVRTSGSGGSNLKLNSTKISRSFESFYEAAILNHEPVSNRDEIYQDPCYLFIYVDDQQTKDALDYLIEWKTQKGFNVAAQSFASGTNATEIKDFIQNAYDNWEIPPEYICLVGDAQGTYNIPASNTTGDHGYTRLDGNDILSDVFIGRLSYETIAQLQTIIYKILHYEKEPYLGQTDWYRKAVVVGDPSPSGPSTIDTKMHIKDMMMLYDQGYDVTEVYSGSFTQQMENSINNGVTYFNYRGFYGMSGFNNANIEGLTNGFMMPVAVFLTCDTGTFVGETSRSEAFLRAGSPGQPKGAIAAIGTATSSTHTCFNNCIDAGIYYGIFSDHIFHIGGALNRGKLNLYLNYYPNGGVSSFSYWNNLMGDPGMDIWTNNPKEIVASFEEIFPLGSNTIEVHVSEVSGEAIEDSWVTFWCVETGVSVSGYSNSAGEVILDIDIQEQSSGKITVTKHDYIPFQDDCYIIPTERFINIFDIQIDDDNQGSSNGNNNGIVNSGETIELGIDLKNFGASSVNGVEAELISISDNVVIIDDTESYGSIAANSHQFSDDDFDFLVDAATLGGTEIEFELRITDNIGNEWFDYFSLPVEGAILYESGYGFPGNVNGILEPGEFSELSIVIENLGTVDAEGVCGILSCETGELLISDNQGYFGDIDAGFQTQNLNDTFELTALSSLIPGSLISVNLQLFNSAGYDNTFSFSITVGQVSVTDPLGPDQYGYFCFDDGDIGYNVDCEYNWIEINEIGAEIPLNDFGNAGDIQTIDLPFTLTFYGEEYNTITVCSNGWLSPGETEIKSFMNWTLPGALGPSPMIAPFWDDLRTPVGGIYYCYLPAMNCFIVEWDEMQNEYNLARETFQVIIYNTDHSPELLNNELKFQYKEFHNVDQGNYPSNHGQYATIGIEDHTSRIGLKYTFDDDYPTSCKVLESESAIYFTGGPFMYYEEPHIVMEGMNLFDENMNNQADYAEALNMQFRLMNVGFESATNVSASISSSDPYITITQASSVYGNIPSFGIELNQTLFELNVDESCPDAHFAPIDISVTSDEGSWNLEYNLELHAPVIEFYTMFVDDGDNNILDPGETTDVQFSFLNSGSSEAFELISNFSETDPLISLDNVTSTIENFLPDNIETVIFTISVDATAPSCYEFSLNWELNGDLNFVAEGSEVMIVDQIPVNLWETFDGNFPPNGWYEDGGINWVQTQTCEAGGGLPEASMHFYPLFNGEQSLVSPPINTLGSVYLELEYNQFVNDMNGNGTNYEIAVLTSSDGQVWHSVWSHAPMANVGPQTNQITITNMDVGSESFQLAFRFSGNSSDLLYWRIDDVILTNASAQQVGFLSGNILLEGGIGTVDDVIIEVGNYYTTPNENGFYHLSVPVGTYSVTAFLSGYELALEENVEVTVGETATADFTLEFMHAPQNLAAIVEESDVLLSWEMSADNREKSSDQEVPDKKEKTKSMLKANDSTRSCCGYKIFRNENMIYQLVNPNMHQYSDEDLSTGTYEYYVIAVYEDTQQSEPSEPITVEITDSNNMLEVNVTRLEANHPNPFNPETTISFQLKTDIDEKTELVIYNLKGQKVRKLISDQLSAGQHSVVWSGKDDNGKTVSSGIYFYKLTSGDFEETRKMLMIK